MRLSTADAFLMLSMPRNRSCLAVAIGMLLGGDCAMRSAAAAMWCIASSPFRKVRGERVDRAVALVASAAAEGSSVHGWSTSFGMHAAMIWPECPLRALVANPLM